MRDPGAPRASSERGRQHGPEGTGRGAPRRPTLGREAIRPCPPCPSPAAVAAAPSPRAVGVVPALLAEPQEDGSVRCNACAMRCLVRPGRAGICGVRENRDGTLVSTVYGRAVAVGLDPIEKKPLFHVAPGALAYSIATVGCPFHCSFCQNWEIAQAPRLGLDLPTRALPPVEGRRRGADGGRARHRLHLRRADGLPRVRPRHGARGPRGRAAERLRDRRLRDPGGDRPPAAGPRRRERRPQVVRRRLLPEAVRGAPGAGARRAARLPGRRRLGGGHDPRHPRPQRRRGRAAGAGRLDRDGAGPGDAVARQPLLPGPPDDGRAADAARRRCAGRPTSGGRPGWPTSTSATPPSWSWRTPAAPGAGASSWSAAATGSSTGWARAGRAPRCGRALAGRALDHDGRVPCG